LAQRETRATTRLYLLTPPALDPDRFAKELEEALAGGDVASLQLRLKDCDDDTIRRATRVLMPMAQDRGVAFIMNDRPDLAAELDCDGVHVGEEDAPYAEARRLLGPDRIVGVTCGASRDRAITAAEAGAVDAGALLLLLLEELQPAASRTAASAAMTAVSRRARAWNGCLARLPAPSGLRLAVTVVSSHGFLLYVPVITKSEAFTGRPGARTFSGKNLISKLLHR